MTHVTQLAFISVHSVQVLYEIYISDIDKDSCLTHPW